jgi:antitoxin ChpS
MLYFYITLEIAMPNAKLRQVGGSTVVAIPPALLKQLGLKADARVTVAVEKDQLVIRPQTRPRYSLTELMGQCDLKAPLRRSKVEREFMDAPRAGKEEI